MSEEVKEKVKDGIDKVRDGVEKIVLVPREVITDSSMEPREIVESPAFRLFVLGIFLLILLTGVWHTGVDTSSPKAFIKSLIIAYDYVWNWAFTSLVGEDWAFIFAQISKAVFTMILGVAWIKPILEWKFWNKVLMFLGVTLIVFVVLISLGYIIVQFKW